MRIPLLLLFYISLTFGAPKSKLKNLPQTVYDQKQTGDYNIQLHLKDFQIIALLSDDALGSLSDYDYNYDYSDFTVKPPNATTVKPNFPSTTSETPEEPLVHSTSPSTSLPSSSSTTPPSSSTEPPTPSVNQNDNKIETIDVSTTKPENITNSPDKIKVQIIQNSGEEIPPLHDIPLGEVVHYRKCASGYARDKRGRCRRVRKPTSGLPFDFGRLASNLAAKLRQNDDESVTSDSTDD